MRAAKRGDVPHRAERVRDVAGERADVGALGHAGDEGDLVEARLRGRVKRERQASDLAVIGDRVTVERLPAGTGSSAEYFPVSMPSSKGKYGTSAVPVAAHAARVPSVSGVRVMTL